MANKEHSNLEGIRKVVSLKSSINLGLSAELKEAFPDIASSPALGAILEPEENKNINKNIHPEWVAGFSTGESNFFITVQNSKNNVGFTTSLRFSIAQHSRDLLLLENLVNLFGGGYVMSYKNRPLCEYIITKIDLVMEKVIPFFNKYPVIGSKHLDFLDFENAAHIIKNKEHLKKEGLEKILSLKKGITLRKINNVTNNHNSDQGTDNSDQKR